MDDVNVNGRLNVNIDPMDVYGKSNGLFITAEFVANESLTRTEVQ